MSPAPRTTATDHRKSSLPIAVTLGDPAGIGPDITLAAWLQRTERRLPHFAVFGDADSLVSRARRLGLDVPIQIVAALAEAFAVFGNALPVLATGKAGQEIGAVLASIEQATAAVMRGEALALLTNPIAKKSLGAVSLTSPGHTELLAVLAASHHPGRSFRPVMMLAAPELKVVPVTVHQPLATVSASLTRTLLLETLRITAHALRTDFGIDHPRLAVCGLNPHAGEGGILGREEIDTIVPAIAELVAEGLAVSGPYSADAMFHAAARAGYDAAIAMYHDQALIPIKTLAFDHAVNVTLGLPFVRTSPDHGTAFDIAGTGKARPGSFLAALELAAEIGQRRATTVRP